MTTPKPPVRLVICDDHAVVRAGLRALLASAPDIEVIGEAGSGPEAVALADRLRPDVILMDLQLGGDMDGIEATRRITSRTGVVPRVLVLTTYDTDADITRAIAAGATGYLLKAERPEELFTAVHSAAQGRTALSAPVANRMLTHIRNPQPTLTPENWTFSPSSPTAWPTGKSPAPSISAKPPSKPTWAASTTNWASKPVPPPYRSPRNNAS